ncbi:unnamed protein product [Dovyalis caffra]|uniref:Uncharacterized protein n=1 Tax=Dovyalis caffra TaxID=77055 RepID=A0AAV1RWA2_9ROSI|nr:unnamed protein product [Dovyalis caffra]
MRFIYSKYGDTISGRSTLLESTGCGRAGKISATVLLTVLKRTVSLSATLHRLSLELYQSLMGPISKWD